jgi:hypothetical protein
MSYPYPSPVVDGLESLQVSADIWTARMYYAPSFLEGWSHGILDLWFFHQTSPSRLLIHTLLYLRAQHESQKTPPCQSSAVSLTPLSQWN